MAAASIDVTAEATKFLNRVRSEFPSLAQNQSLLDAVVNEMKRLNVTVENATADNFYAGFLSARANGLVHAVSVAEQHTADRQAELARQTAQQAEELRIQRENAEHQRQQDEARAERIRKQNDPRRHTHESHNPVKEAAEAAEGVRGALLNIREGLCKAEAENLSCYRPDGTIDRQATAELQKIEYRKNGAINWQQTLFLRKQAAKQFEHQQRIKRDVRG